MRELEKTFEGKGEVKGYVFNQVKASLFGYIYERTSEEGGKTFEVFKRRENTLYNLISYPGSKAFGIWAWAVPTLERAEEKLLEINASEKVRLLIK